MLSSDIIWPMTVSRTVLLLVLVLASRPAFAQVDISGNWRPMARNEDGSGMTGDAAGLPITMSSRWRADSWSPEDFDVAEWVCRPHTWDYTLETILTQMRIWPEVDQATQQVIAIHVQARVPAELAQPLYECIGPRLPT